MVASAYSCFSLSIARIGLVAAFPGVVLFRCWLSPLLVWSGLDAFCCCAICHLLLFCLLITVPIAAMYGLLNVHAIWHVGAMGLHYNFGSIASAVMIFALPSILVV
ncbi:hypothetical protein U1Q18_020348 [Sarracenia purpurea var. burkii]